jgi:peptide deformylase
LEKKLNLYKYGENILRVKCKPIENVTPSIAETAQKMLKLMYAYRGVGLAAPQAGLDIALCVIDVPNEDGKKNPIVLINPKIVSGETKITEEEGCLSFPQVYEKVKRFKTVTAEYTALDGKIYKITTDGLLAKALQHEIDHLSGKLFIDYLPDWKRKQVLKEIKRRQKVNDW